MERLRLGGGKWGIPSGDYQVSTSPIARYALSFRSGRQQAHSWVYRPGAQNSRLDKEEIRKLVTFRWH